MPSVLMLYSDMYVKCGCGNWQVRRDDPKAQQKIATHAYQHQQEQEEP